jgi:prepilin peptidase CpaA
MSPTPDTVYILAALVSAGIGSVYDIRSSRIPNVLTASSIAVGLLLHLTIGGWAQLAFSMFGGLVGGGLFLLFFLLGGMGAGDVKLMAAIGCLVGLASLARVLIATVLAGAVLAILLALYRGKLRQTITNVAALAVHYQENGLSQHDELTLENVLTLRMPYAVPIALGCMVAFWMLVKGGW